MPATVSRMPNLNVRLLHEFSLITNQIVDNTMKGLNVWPKQDFQRLLDRNDEVAVFDTVVGALVAVSYERNPEAPYELLSSAYEKMSQAKLPFPQLAGQRAYALIQHFRTGEEKWPGEGEVEIVDCLSALAMMFVLSEYGD